MKEGDPRAIITPDAFRVNPALLGLPLAGPFRRGAAMLLDLALVGLLVLLKELTGVVFWLALAWVLFRVSSHTAQEGVGSAAGRAFVRIAAVVILVFAIGSVLIPALGPRIVTLPDRAPGPGESDRAGAASGDSGPGEVQDTAAGAASGAAGEAGEGLSLRDMARVPDLIALGAAASEEEALPAARRVADALTRAGTPPGEVHEALRELLRAGEGDEPWRARVVELAVAPIEEAEAERFRKADSLVAAYGRAVAEGDPARVGPARRELFERVETEELAVARARIARLEAELDRTRDEAAEGPGLLEWMRELADELGLGIGWLGLYFTVFTVMWRGQTPGKRLLGIRVVRLNGEPIGWWTSFSRFGGYAACLFTGMIGFVETFWDANRQGLQDKMVGTVVIVTGGSEEEAYERPGPSNATGAPDAAGTPAEAARHAPDPAERASS